MIKLLSQLEHVDNATPLARRLDGKISDGIAPRYCQPCSTLVSAASYMEQGPWNNVRSIFDFYHVDVTYQEAPKLIM